MAVAETSIIDFLNFLTFDKTPWAELSTQDQKKFDPYMINKWLSMESNGILCPVIHMIQRYTVNSDLSKKDIYNLYFDLLPKEKYFFKYIKPSDEKNRKYSERLVDIVSEYYLISKREAKDYINLYYETENDYVLRKIVSSFGLEEKEIDKIFKE